jgi:hypothetical protein
MKKTLSLVAVALVIGLGVHAQSKPNFAGRWVQVTPTAEAEGGGSEQVITQTATTVTTEHPSEGGGHRQTFTIDAESKSMVGQIPVVSKTAWVGQTLVITSVATYPGDVTRESKQIWSLRPDGTMAIEFTLKNPDGTTTEIKSVHRKR